MLKAAKKARGPMVRERRATKGSGLIMRALIEVRRTPIPLALALGFAFDRSSRNHLRPGRECGEKERERESARARVRIWSG